MAVKHVTTTGAGTKSGDDWDNAYDEPALETFLEGSLAAGDVVYIKPGTYSLDSTIDFTARDGTVTAPIVIIGVKTATTNTGTNVVYSDWERTPANFPLIDGGASWIFSAGDFTRIRNIAFSGETSGNCTIGASCLVENCKFENDFGSAASRYALITGANCRVINSYVTSANTHGINHGGGLLMFSYLENIPGSTRQAVLCGGTVHALFNTFDNCTIAMNITTASNGYAINNTFYDCGDALSATSGGNWVVVNNIVESGNANGFLWTTPTDSGFFWENHGDDARNTDMWDGVATNGPLADLEVTTGDPSFQTAGSDYSLQAGSPCLNTGMSITLGV